MSLCRSYACTLFLVLTFFAASAGAKTIAAGGGHSCAISSSGKVMCWGDNSAGQLGIGYHSAVTAFNYYPVKLDSQDVPVAITAGGTHTCVLLKTGLVKCWGDNSSGQLGTGKMSSVESAPVSVVGLNGVKAIAAGLKHTCALYGWGSVKCWGNNQYGQLGNGLLTNSAVPVNVLYIFGLVDLAVGDNHSCAMSSDKSSNAFCWGKNEAGQLGNKSNTDSKSAVLVSLDKPSISLAAGGDRTCAILIDKTVQCWGWWFEKVNAVFHTSAPQSVTGLNNIGNIAVGQKHTCVRDISLPAQPKLKCWGNNSHAEVGLASGATPEFVDGPTAMSITNPVIEVAAGNDHTCAIATISGIPVLKCWGNDTFGQLGMDPQNTYLKTDPKNPNIKFSPAPITISTVQISAMSVPLDMTAAPAIPAPSPPPVACV
jgi:alpha-tubulin suppressor-like RCC1 family protein